MYSHNLQQIRHQPGMIANSARGQLNRENRLRTRNQGNLIDIFFLGFTLLTNPIGLQCLGKSTPTIEDACSRRPGVKEVSKSVLVA